MQHFSTTLATLTALSLGACSSAKLHKFDEGDIGKEISQDAGKKFEVKEVGSAAADNSKQSVEKKTLSSKKPESLKTKKNKLRISSAANKAQTRKRVEGGPGVPLTADPTATPVLPPVRRVEPMAFDIGERLNYDIRYLGVTAGTFNLEVLPVKEMNERKVYHLQARAKTVKIFELVYRVNDLIESFWDYDGLYSHRFTMDLDESKQTRKLIELYDYEKKKSFYWNRVDHTEKGLKEEKQSYDIQPWSQDLVSSLYYLRTVKLPTETGAEFRFPVVVDGKPWESVLHFKKQETIYAGGKDRLADVYTLQNFQNGESKNRENTLWMSADEHRYVLRVETKVKVGSFAVALDQVL